MPSAVQARNSTSATSSGFTQMTPRAASAVSFSAKGELLRLQRLELRATRSAATSRLKPVPTRPTCTSLPSLW